MALARSRRRPLRRFQPVLRPRAGRKLPRELAPRRVWRLAARIPGGLEDPTFETLLQRIDEAPVLGGNAVTLYFSGQDAFPAMSEAGRAALSEILVESYILKDDATGRIFLDEMAAAAERGVTVRVLADALGSASTHATYWQELEARGVQVRLFHPLFEKLWYGAFRDHRKIVVVDRRIAFTGGMNIGEEYGSPRPKPG